MSSTANNNDEIDLKQLAKRVVNISKKKKKIFTYIFLGIMLLSTAYFIKVLVKPSYKSEVILKSRIVRKDALEKILEKYNIAIKTNESNLPKDLIKIFENNHIVLFEVTEIKADITSPDKNDATKYYKLVTYYSQKPSVHNIENVNAIIENIKETATIDNDILIGRIKTEEAIAELDTLLLTALPAGNSFKQRMDASSNMLIMNDIYRSLSDLLARKSQLKTELMYFQTDNLIFKASPLVLNKKISYPVVIFLIGFFIWFFICTLWVGGILIFGDEE